MGPAVSGTFQNCVHQAHHAFKLVQRLEMRTDIKDITRQIIIIFLPNLISFSFSSTHTSLQSLPMPGKDKQYTTHLHCS